MTRLTTDQRNLQDLTQLVSSFLQASGLAGATVNTRYVGGTSASAPVSGTFAAGDWVASQDGNFYICTTAGTPGTWSAVGGGSVPAFATPAIVLGTAAAAGVAGTIIRSDATIVAFDATAPVTQASGDTAATGSAAVAARRDHKHGMPTIQSTTLTTQNVLVGVAGTATAQPAGNEVLASSGLVNATSAGDAGNRADHFLGTSLGGQWTASGGTISSTVVGNSIYLPVSSAFAIISQPYTPSGTFKIRARFRRGSISTATQIWLFVGDGTFAVNGSNTFTGNCVATRLADSSGSNGPNSYALQSVDTGTQTTRQTVTGVADNNEWVWVELSRASNVWTSGFSADGGVSVQTLPTYSKTFTAAIAGLVVISMAAGWSAIDLFDVVS